MKVNLLIFAIFAILFPLDAVAGPVTPFIPAIFTALAGAGGAIAAASAFGGDKDTPPLPEDKPAGEQAVAPKPDDAARRRVQERTIQRKFSQMGRVGTILLDESNKLG